MSPLVGTWYYAFNYRRPAFSGPGQIALKKAINFAVDRPTPIFGMDITALCRK